MRMPWLVIAEKSEKHVGGNAEHRAASLHNESENKKGGTVWTVPPRLHDPRAAL